MVNCIKSETDELVIYLTVHRFCVIDEEDFSTLINSLELFFTLIVEIQNRRFLKWKIISL